MKKLFSQISIDIETFSDNTLEYIDMLKVRFSAFCSSHTQLTAVKFR